MKSLPLLLLACLALTLPAAAAVKAIAPDETAITKALADKSKPAKAAWWGFDPEDSTTLLQAAIDSGVSKLIIENLGAPWVTEGLQLASNQEIVFEKDVVILAKRGAFKGRHDSLFSAVLQENITLTGHGATFRMWREDYADPEKYEKAEWRHTLNFRSCSNVRISGLTLTESGGDGIYLGIAKRGFPCTDFVIKDVACLDNYRQGISVISARNLLIEDCLLKSTSGTNPQAGIDFEPNNPSEELSNCVMRNCVSENNTGAGYVLYLPALNETSKPISIRLENCRAIGNSASFSLTAASPKKGGPSVRGEIEVINCEFIESRGAAISIRNKEIDGANLRFENCSIKNPAQGKPKTTPIHLSSTPFATETFGMVHFDKVTIEDPEDRLPMSYHDYSGGVGLDKITGTIRLKKPGAEEVDYPLTESLVREWMPFPIYKKIPPFDPSGHHFAPVKSAPDLSTNHGARLRGISSWLLWAEAGDKVTYVVKTRQVGRIAASEMDLELFAPSGKRIKPKHNLESGDNVLSFEAKETGAYKIITNAKRWSTTVNSDSHRIALFSNNEPFNFLSTRGEFYFWRPAGNEEFAVRVAGEAGSEMVKAALIDPQGKLVEEVDNISQAHQFLISTPAEKDELWSLRLARPSEGYFEDFSVRLEGVPSILSGNRDDLLKMLPAAP